VLAAIIFVATSGCTWRQLPPVFGASWQTVHRRFTDWSAARVWAKIGIASTLICYRRTIV
jgi:transposase